ncbi:hypothetical protein E7Z59_07765 [Robertkochia marina]|uniref:Uncharacterized protein n=1 Tax=Robertkochia marina TaxID=1227945 RepID=A0A4S3LZJ3_9FLAO|nr:hypothetical protein [Robertkochia marina]THD67550.1 hypothetical protein E7Z59_07765 [Robertkochia marina]TRZ44582.1 hypothetical protein D3A96_08180 [Robertkochia marina]
MYVKKAHSILAVIFLTAFLSAQFAVYHTFSHDSDSIETCKVCDEAITFGDTPVLLFDGAPLEELIVLPPIQKVSNNSYQAPLTDSDYQEYIYSRPPPSVLQA